MLVQRVYGPALGYEDLDDHDQLRHDPTMIVLAGKQEPDQPLASKSTLCRLERTPAGGAAQDRYQKIRYDAEAIDGLLLDLFLESHTQAPEVLRRSSASWRDCVGGSARPCAGPKPKPNARVSRRLSLARPVRPHPEGTKDLGFPPRLLPDLARTKN